MPLNPCAVHPHRVDDDIAVTIDVFDTGTTTPTGYEQADKPSTVDVGPSGFSFRTSADLDTQEVEPSKPITAPTPVVSKSVLREPDSTDGNQAGPEPGATEAGGVRTATLVREEDEIAGASTDDPELFLDTAEMDIIEEPRLTVQPRSRPALGVLALVVVAVAAVGGFLLTRDYARSGYFVAETETTGELVVFQGRRGGFLGFDPQRLSATTRIVDELDDVEQSMLEADFSSRAEAESLIDQIEERQALQAAEAAASAGPSDSSQADEQSESTQQSSKGVFGRLGLHGRGLIGLCGPERSSWACSSWPR